MESLRAHFLQRQVADVGRHGPQPGGALLRGVKPKPSRARPIQGLHLKCTGPAGGGQEMLEGGPWDPMPQDREKAAPTQPCSAPTCSHRGKHSSQPWAQPNPSPYLR